ESVPRLHEAWQDPSKVTCPTLVVRGAVSDVFTDEDAESFSRALPNSRWVRVEGAGHTVQGDQPRRLLEVLREVLTALGRSGTGGRGSTATTRGSTRATPITPALLPRSVRLCP